MSSRRRRAREARLDPQTRAALRGLDGGEQLRAALDMVQRSTGAEDMLVVNNGSRGPGIIDTRALPPGGWVAQGLIPTGVVAAIADLDDPPPEALLDSGFDAVLLLEFRGAVAEGVPVRQSVHFHPRLGLTPPEPMWIKLDLAQGGFVRADAPPGLPEAATFREQADGGRRTMMLLPEVPDDAPDWLKNALATRNACSVDGQCPTCGATPTLSVDEGGLGHLTFLHEDGCDCLCDERKEIG